MFKKIAGVLSMSVLILGTAACGNEGTNPNEQNSESNENLKVYTTVYPLKYFTEQIAGDEAMVETILPPGSNPHNYEPTTDEMVKIAESDAFIFNGAGLEPYAKQISDAIETEDVKIVEASKGLELIDHSHDHAGEEGHEEDHAHEGEEGHEEDHAHEEEEGHEEEDHAHEEEEGHEEEDHAHEGEEGHEEDHAHEEEEGHEEDHAHEEDEGNHEEGHEGHDHGDKDPHVWLDPIRSIQLAENIKDTLVELKPAKEETFNNNFEELKKKLEDLDEEFHKGLESLPENKIIVSHAAYGYWEQAYGIEQISVSGLSPDNEPSQKELQNIIETAEKYGLNYVFFEQNVTPKVAEVVKNEIGAEALRIHNLSVLTEEDISNEEDYFTLMHQNLDTLSEALSGD